MAINPFEFSPQKALGQAFQGLKKAAGITFDDQEPEVVSQANQFETPKFQSAVFPVRKELPLAEPLKGKFPAFGKKFQEVTNTLLSSAHKSAIDFAGNASSYLSAYIKESGKKNKEILKEAESISDGFQRQNFLIQNGYDASSEAFGKEREWVADRLTTVKNIADKERQKVADLYPDPDFSDKPFSENVKDPNFWASGIGGALPSIVGNVILGYGVAATTKNPAAVGAALFGNSYLMESGAGYEEAKRHGLSDEDAVRAGNWIGVVNGAIESFFPAKVVNNATKPLKNTIAKKIINYVSGAGIESLTEVTQEFWTNIVRSSYDETARYSDNLLESGLFGAVASVFGERLGDILPRIKMGKPSLGLSIQDIGRDEGEIKENLTVLDETIKSHPAFPLTEYANKNQELPEVIGEGGKFKKTGDQIITELGFADSEEARRSYEELTKLRALRSEMQSQLKRVGAKEEAKLPVEMVSEEVTEEEISKLFSTAPAISDIRTDIAPGITPEVAVAGREAVVTTPKVREVSQKTTKQYVDKVKRDVEALGGIDSETIVQDMNEVGGYKFRDIDDLKTAVVTANRISPDKITPMTLSEKEVAKRVMAVEKEQRRLLSKAQREAMAVVKGKKPLSKVVSVKEEVALKQKLRQQARGARYGYKAGYLEAKEAITNQLRNRFEEKISDMGRQEELDKIKRGILTRHQQQIKSDIVKYIKDNLPLAARGKFLTVTASAKTQKDLGKVFVRVNIEVDSLAKKEIINNLKSDIERVTNAQNIAIDIKNKIIDLFKGVDLTKRTKATIESLEATKRYIEIKKAEGEDVAMPERILEKLQILARKPASEMTLEELASLRDEVALLERLGKTKLASREANYQAEKEDRAEVIFASAQPINLRETKKKPVGSDLSAGEKIANTIKKTLNVLQEKKLMVTPIDGIAEIMGVEPLKAKHDLNHSNMLEAIKSHIDERTEIINRNKLNKNNTERAGVVAHSKQEGGLEKLENGGITEQEVSDIESTLTDGEKEFMNFVRREFDSFYPLVKEFARVNYNVDVGKIDNYVSFQTDYDAMSDIPVYERFGNLADNAIANRRKNVKKGFIEERAGAGKQKIIIDLDRIYLRHLRSVFYMLHMGKDIKMDAEVINTPEGREKLGDLGQLMWLEWLDLMARDGGSRANVVPFIDYMRKNTTGAILAYRLSSAMVQITAIASGASEIGGTYATEGLYKIGMSTEWRQFVKNNFPEVMATVGDDPAFTDLGEGWFSKVTKAGITPLIKSDMMTRSAVAIGAYIRSIEQRGLELNLNNPDKEAITEAQKIVRKTQGSSLAKDLPFAITSGALTSRGLSLGKGERTLVGSKSVDKMLTALQSFVFANWNNIESAVWRQGIKKGDYKKAASGVMWLMIIAPLMEMGVRDVSKWLIGLLTGLDDDKEKDKNILADLIKEDLGRIPLIGPIMNSVSYGSNPVPLIQTAGRAIEGGRRIKRAEEAGEVVSGLIDVAAGAGGPLLGIPTQMVDIMEKYLISTGAIPKTYQLEISKPTKKFRSGKAGAKTKKKKFRTVGGD